MKGIVLAKTEHYVLFFCLSVFLVSLFLWV